MKLGFCVQFGIFVVLKRIKYGWAVTPIWIVVVLGNAVLNVNVWTWHVTDTAKDVVTAGMLG